MFTHFSSMLPNHTQSNSISTCVDMRPWDSLSWRYCIACYWASPSHFNNFTEYVLRVSGQAEVFARTRSSRFFRMLCSCVFFFPFFLFLAVQCANLVWTVDCRRQYLHITSIWQLATTTGEFFAKMKFETTKWCEKKTEILFIISSSHFSRNKNEKSSRNSPRSTQVVISSSSSALRDQFIGVMCFMQMCTFLHKTRIDLGDDVKERDK